MKLAALDLGSNSFHLLVAEAGDGGELIKLGSQKAVLQLGCVVREQRHLPQDVFERALDSVAALATTARRLGAGKLVSVGTSALRDAHNGQLFLDACRVRLGVEVELLSGDDEARLAYLGARSGLPLTSGRLLVADVGGGSLELACGTRTECDAVQSLPLGFLRLAHPFPVTDVTGSRRLAHFVRMECEKVRPRLGRFDRLALSGGTARALGKLMGGGVAGASATEVERLCQEVARLSPRQLERAGVDATRSATLATGAAVIAGVIAGLGQSDVRFSPRGLREGVLLRELARRRSQAA